VRLEKGGFAIQGKEGKVGGGDQPIRAGKKKKAGGIKRHAGKKKGRKEKTQKKKKKKKKNVRLPLLTRSKTKQVIKPGAEIWKKKVSSQKGGGKGGERWPKGGGGVSLQAFVSGGSTK